MDAALVPRPVRVQVDPEERISRHRPEGQSAVFVRPPEVVDVVSARVRVVDVREPRLPALAVVLEDGEEARHAVPRPPVAAHPHARRLRGIVPVVVLVEELPRGVPHELRRPDVVLARVYHAPHEVLGTG